ncbi:MAG: hypothetical protein QOJ70_3573 [Acidobacteriota bacterium]|jgi:hypothetical protein|nr:hypothetical protein [Acidobacteriota bacterium]
MTVKAANDVSQTQGVSDGIKAWVMVLLTIVFVALYGAALTGWLRPLPDEKMVARLEPIIFVIIGYYFGRLPAQQTEKTLKDEVTRQTQKADAAQHAKEQAQQSRESLEEKVKNARAVLAPAASAKSISESTDVAGRAGPLRISVSAALDILDS